ncbi:hypothetical protein Tco_1556759 [Tanacetum coccineum]
MTREEDDGISVALDPQTFNSGFCISSEWEVVCLGGTTLVEVNLVKGHELPTIVIVLPIGFHLNPDFRGDNTRTPVGFDPPLLVNHFTPVRRQHSAAGEKITTVGLQLFEDFLLSRG